MEDQERSSTVEDERAKRAYLQSCKEMMSAINSLESACIAFAGQDAAGIRGHVFTQSRARLEQELTQADATGTRPT